MGKVVVLTMMILLSILSISMISAVPMVPVVFAGEATYSGNSGLSLTGYDINFTVGSYGPVKAGTVSSNNLFEIDVDPNGATGTIKFFVGGIEAAETGTYVRGGFIPLDLTINSAPTQVLGDFCGDGNCNSGETCNTCSTDCLGHSL